jgi:hypothetical protein
MMRSILSSVVFFAWGWVCGASNNLVINGNFEDDLDANMRPDYIGWSTISPPVLNFSAGRNVDSGPLQGTNCIQFDVQPENEDSYIFNEDPVECVVGQVFGASIYLSYLADQKVKKKKGGLPGETGVSLRLIYLDNSGAYLSSQDVDWPTISGRGWKRMSITGKAPDLASSVHVRFVARALPVGTIYADDLSLYRIPESGFLTSENLAPNSSLNDLSGGAGSNEFKYFSDNIGNLNHTISQVDDGIGGYWGEFRHKGSVEKELYISSNHSIGGTKFNEAGVVTFHPSVPEGMYEASANVKIENGYTGAGVRVMLYFFSIDVNGGQPVFHSVIQSKRINGYTTNGEWTRIYVRGIAPKGGDYVYASVKSKARGALTSDSVVYVDQVSLSKQESGLYRNLSFEEVYSPAEGVDSASYFRARTVNGQKVLSGLETGLGWSYSGRLSAYLKYSVGGVSSDYTYYHAGYSEDGSATEFISVDPGDRYRLTGFARMNDDGGDSVGSVGIAFLYYDSLGENPTIRSENVLTDSEGWEYLSLVASVPDGYDQLGFTVESYHFGNNDEGWFDKMNLVNTNLVENPDFSDETNPLLGYLTSYDYDANQSTSNAVFVMDDETAPLSDDIAVFNFSEVQDVNQYIEGPAYSFNDVVSVREISVRPGEIYELSARVSVPTSDLIDIVLVGREAGSGTLRTLENDISSSNGVWENLTTGMVEIPFGYDGISYRVNYSGSQLACISELALKEINLPNHDGLFQINHIQDVSDSGSNDIRTAADLYDAFLIASDIFVGAEKKYCITNDTLVLDASCIDGPLAWGNGYSDSSAPVPLVRCTANAVLAYINVMHYIMDENEGFPDELSVDYLNAKVFHNRIMRGIIWLLHQGIDSSEFVSASYESVIDENVDGSFYPWYSPSGVIKTRACYYSTGFSGLALGEAYMYMERLKTVLNLSEDFSCDVEADQFTGAVKAKLFSSEAGGGSYDLQSACLLASDDIVNFFDGINSTSDLSLVSPNASFNMLATWALAANVRVHVTEASTGYMDSANRALELAAQFIEEILTGQTEQGYLSDPHIQYSGYHGIVTQGLVMFQHTFDQVRTSEEGNNMTLPSAFFITISHASMKAMNHIIRALDLDAYPAEKANYPWGFRRHPTIRYYTSIGNSDDYRNEPHFIAAVAHAFGTIDYNNSNISNLMSYCVRTADKFDTPETVQGHEFYALSTALRFLNANANAD